MPLRYRIGKALIWLQGFLIVLALLGHDLLMASPAPVAATAPTTGELHHHTPTHAVVDGTAALPLGHPGSPHPSVCGTGGIALFPPVDQLGIADLSTLAVTTPSYFPRSAHTSTFLWAEPHWPPGTRRALLQVYRI